MMLVLFCGWFCVLLSTFSISAKLNILSIRGGLVPEANEQGGDYYDQFQLDYGREDNVRIAGQMRGLIKSGKISSLPEKDPFLKWINEHLEKGPEEFVGRIKPYYVSFQINLISLLNFLFFYKTILHRLQILVEKVI
jgi:hypothetical protein